MKGLLSFRHGVHPPEEKDITSGIHSRRFPFPDQIILPNEQVNVVRIDPTDISFEFKEKEEEKQTG